MNIGLQTKGTVPALELSRFSGINDVDHATRIEPELVQYERVYPLVQANNVDIDNSMRIKSRPGRSLLVSGTDMHSLWSDGEKCFFVDGSILYQLMEDYSVLEICRGLQTGARMSYAQFNDKTYYTNGFQCGYVKNYINYAYMNPNKTFKEPLPAGNCIDVYNNIIMTSVDNVLYISDPLSDYYDTRRGYRIFKDTITMIRAVDGGVYVSDNQVWFIRGGNNEEFERLEVYPERAVRYTDVKVASQFVGLDGSDSVAMWTGMDGVCIGDSNGKVTNITKDKYIIEPHEMGGAFIRNINQVKHYINSLY